jgi:hypothetical protein
MKTNRRIDPKRPVAPQRRAGKAAPNLVKLVYNNGSAALGTVATVWGGAWLLSAVACSFAQGADSRWQGTDETVVERFAAAAGRPAREPLLPAGGGDLPLFFTLVAGAVAGFIAGYTFRALFPPKTAKHGPPIVPEVSSTADVPRN